jgi:hypothetical protein
MLNPNPTGSLAVLRCDQFSSGSTFIRTGTNLATVQLELSAEAGGAEGFSIHFYASGTHGLNEIRTRTDLGGRRALDPFIAVAIDDEAPQDRPDQNKPNSTRKGGRR